MSRDVNNPDKWEKDYARGTDGWDLGGPTPIFRRLLDQSTLVAGRAIVLGAGRGHDAREFARRGFDVTAVDFSPTAAAEMRRLAAPDAPVAVHQADIFTLPATFNHRFDYVIEYTCFCAIDPARRPEYAALVDRLLKPGGVFIALAFPMGGGPGGPPFAVDASEFPAFFAAPAYALKYWETPSDSVAQRRDQEALYIFQKTAARGPAV
jgi:SAM-dependent methyltransferase